MTDKFKDFADGLESPARYVENVTPDDVADLPNASRAINVQTTGSVQVTTVAGTIATVFVAAGIAFPVRVKRIWATGTTATGIAVLY